MRVYPPNEFKDMLTERGFPILPSSEDQFPPNLLFRGCHIAELNPLLSLSEIQGRPCDTSYSGNILHLSNSFARAYSYSNCPTEKKFSDDRRGVVAYSSLELMKFGTFTPDKVDTRALTAEESLKDCEQMRWECYDLDAQAKRLKCIAFIIFDSKIFYPNQLEELITYIPEPKIVKEYNCDFKIGSKYFVLNSTKLEVYSLINHYNEVPYNKLICNSGDYLVFLDNVFRNESQEVIVIEFCDINLSELQLLVTILNFKSAFDSHNLKCVYPVTF